MGNHPHLKHYRELHPHIILVNLDATLQIIAEAMLNKSAEVGVRIQQIFVEGDTNSDGVLSFSEFMDIVKKVAPEFHERKILKMYREALMKGELRREERRNSERYISLFILIFGEIDVSIAPISKVILYSAVPMCFLS